MKALYLTVGSRGVTVRISEELMNARKKIPESPRPIAPVPMPDGDELRRRVAERAYGLYVARGRAPGHDLEDWLQAERLVRAELAAPVQRAAGRQRTTLSH